MTLAVTASEADDSVGATGERPEHAPPRLAEGIELFGEYEAGGFIEPKYLLRRADGQVIELPASSTWSHPSSTAPTMSHKSPSG